MVKLGSGYLQLIETQGMKSWNVELYHTNDDDLFSSIMEGRLTAKLKIGTKDGKGFLGMALVSKLNLAPLGITVHLQGTGKLEDVY